MPRLDLPPSPSILRKKTGDAVSFGGVIFSLGVAAAILFFTRRPRVPLLIGYAILLGLSFVPIAFYVIFAKWRDLEIDEVGIFTGGRIAEFEIAGVPVRINSFPLGGYVKFRHRDEEAGHRMPTGRRTFDEARLWERLMFSLIPGAALLLIAVLARGGRPAIASFVAAFGQLLHAVCSPVHVAPHLLKRYFQLASAAPLSVTIAVLARKLAAFSLICSAPSISRAILGAVSMSSKKPSVLQRVYNAATILILLAMLLTIGVALCAYLFGRVTAGFQ